MYKMVKVINEIQKERAYQVERWGTETDVEVNSAADFVLYITHYATRWFKNSIPPHGFSPEYREDMVKVATLAMAAVEAYDKREEENNNG
jgi:hypothetical protein